MNSEMFKAFGVFCFSVICFGVVTAIAGVLLSFGDNDAIFAVAWVVSIIIFGIVMTIEHDDDEEEL